MQLAIRTFGQVLLAMAVTISPAAFAQSGDMWGAMIGAVAGGILGNQIGGGQGRVAATAAGAVVGAMAGERLGSDRNYSPPVSYRQPTYGSGYPTGYGSGYQYQQPANRGGYYAPATAYRTHTTQGRTVIVHPDGTVVQY